MLDALANAVTDAVLAHGLLAVFLLMLLESACIPVPAEVTMLYAGYLVSRDDASFVGIVAAGVLGNVAGSVLVWWIGASGGRHLLERHGRWFGVRARHMDSADTWFERHGRATVLVGRCLPIVRTFISLPAGVARMPLVPFVTYTFIGCVPFVAAFAWLGVALGPQWSKAHDLVHYADYAVAAALVVAAVVVARRLRRRPAAALER